MYIYIYIKGTVHIGMLCGYLDRLNNCKDVPLKAGIVVLTLGKVNNVRQHVWAPFIDYLAFILHFFWFVGIGFIALHINSIIYEYRKQYILKSGRKIPIIGIWNISILCVFRPYIYLFTINKPACKTCIIYRYVYICNQFTFNNLGVSVLLFFYSPIYTNNSNQMHPIKS